jgi:hypothetical protein
MLQPLVAATQSQLYPATLHSGADAYLERETETERDRSREGERERGREGGREEMEEEREIKRVKIEQEKVS